MLCSGLCILSPCCLAARFQCGFWFSLHFWQAFRSARFKLNPDRTGRPSQWASDHNNWKCAARSRRCRSCEKIVQNLGSHTLLTRFFILSFWSVAKRFRRDSFRLRPLPDVAIFLDAHSTSTPFLSGSIWEMEFESGGLHLTDKFGRSSGEKIDRSHTCSQEQMWGTNPKWDLNFVTINHKNHDTDQFYVLLLRLSKTLFMVQEWIFICEPVLHY